MRKMRSKGGTTSNIESREHSKKVGLSVTNGLRIVVANNINCFNMPEWQIKNRKLYIYIFIYKLYMYFIYIYIYIYI